MNVLINAASIFVVLGCFTSDLLRRRLLSVVGTSCVVTYFYNQPEPMMNVVAWDLMFPLLNLVQLAQMLCSRWSRVGAGWRGTAVSLRPWPRDGAVSGRGRNGQEACWLPRMAQRSSFRCLRLGPESVGLPVMIYGRIRWSRVASRATSGLPGNGMEEGIGGPRRTSAGYRVPVAGAPPCYDL